MKLDRFNEFVTHIRSDHLIVDALVSYNVYRTFESKWYDEEANEIGDEKLINSLDKTLNVNKSWKAPKSKECYFPIDEMSAVVVGLFAQTPKSRTRNKVYEDIGTCFTNATHAYEASHRKRGRRD